MIPKLKKRTQHTFDRIGNSYAPYIDAEHFMGRSAFDDSWTKYNAPVNVIHQEDQCVIEVALPGFPKDRIRIHADEDSIHFQADRDEEAIPSDAVHAELATDHIRRTFSLPPHARLKKITAVYDEGVVRINIPLKKTPEIREIILQ